MKKRFAFLYLDKTYGVYHSISIALELSLLDNTEVIVFTNKRSSKLVKQILLKKKNTVKIRIVKPYWHFEVPVYVEIKIQMRRLYFMRYKKELSEVDVIISGIYNDLELKQYLDKDVKIIYTGHGVSNAIYSFNDAIKGFDYVLLPGKWEFEKRIKNKQVIATNCSVVGYPKLDVVSHTSNKLFNNDNKVIIYNPHWNKRLSSYYKFGQVILNYFKNNPEYNLIFAPHSLLKERNYKMMFDLKKFKNCPNILIDYGSENSNNMIYTKVSDIYLGDFSSQALEFGLQKLRPCVFINALNFEDRDAPISWGMGEVYNSVTVKNLSLIFEKADRLFNEKYREEQGLIINRLFTIPAKETSSAAAAQSVFKYINNQ